MPSNPRNLRVAREITRRDMLFSVARVPNSERLFVASSETKVYEIDAAALNVTPIEHANHGRYVTCVRLVAQDSNPVSAGNAQDRSPVPLTVISGGYDGRLIWWNARDRREIRTIDGHSRQVRYLAVSPDGTKIASVGDDMVCRIWNVATGAKLHELRGHEERTPTHFGSMLYVCAYSNDGRYLATGDRVGHVVIWDANTGRQLSAVEAPTLYTWDGTQRIRSIGGVRGLAFSPDGSQLAVGGVGQIGNVDALQGPSRVEIIDWNRRQRLGEMTGQQGIFNKLIWTADWLCAIGGGSNGFVNFWNASNRTQIHQGNVSMHVHDAAVNEDGTKIYAVGHQKIAVLELRG